MRKADLRRGLFKLGQYDGTPPEEPPPPPQQQPPEPRPQPEQPEEEYKKGEVVSYTDKTGNVITATIVSVGVGLEDGFVGIRLPDGNIRDTQIDRLSKREQPQPEPQPQPQPQPQPKQSWDDLMSLWDEQDAGVGDGEPPKGMELTDDGANWKLFSGDGQTTNYKLTSRWTFTDVDGKIGKKVKGKEYWIMKITDSNISIVGKDNAGLKRWNNVSYTKLDAGLDDGTIKIVKG